MMAADEHQVGKIGRSAVLPGHHVMGSHVAGSTSGKGAAGPVAEPQDS
jgi:hypothetical protein